MSSYSNEQSKSKKFQFRGDYYLKDHLSPQILEFIMYKNTKNWYLSTPSKLESCLSSSKVIGLTKYFPKQK